MKKAPCARLGMRIRPKISEKPDDNRNKRPPKATLFSVWMIQNCHCIDGSLLAGECPFVPDAMQHRRQVYAVCASLTALSAKRCIADPRPPQTGPVPGLQRIIALRFMLRCARDTP